MLQKRSRIVIDTNLWISFLIRKSYSELDSMVLNNKVTLLFSEESLQEFLEVTQRPKFKKYFNQKDVQDLLNLIKLHAEFIVVKTKVNICRDPEDNFIIALAIDGKASHILTGDKDLLVLKKIKSISIIKISEFI